ncbi:MAG: hypothetical protein AAB460_01165 [Patescibacteria group bacterium]
MKFFSFLVPLFSVQILWIVWGLAFLFYVIAGSIFIYHWNSYSPNDRRVTKMKWIYFVGGAILLLITALFVVSL